MSTCFGLVVIEAQKNLHLLYHLFSLYMLAIIPLTGGMTDVVVPTACTGYWVGPPLCSMVVIGPLQGRVCSLVVGVEATPCSTSELCVCPGVVRLLGLEHSHQERSHQVFLHWSTCVCALLCHLIHILWAPKVHCCTKSSWHCSWPHLSLPCVCRGVPVLSAVFC